MDDLDRSPPPALRRRDDHTTYDLARSACLFSRRMRRVVEDKLGFAAALVQAGDLAAACRLFAELEGLLEGESAALTGAADVCEFDRP